MELNYYVTEARVAEQVAAIECISKCSIMLQKKNETKVATISLRKLFPLRLWK